MNYGQQEIESTIIASLLKQPDILEKVRVKGYMFTDERYKAFFEYVMDVGKVDHSELYLKATNDKSFLDVNTITKLYNTDFIGYGFFERYQQELVERYQINKANELINDFKQDNTTQNFNNLIDELRDLKTITDTKEDGTKRFVEEFVEELYSDTPKKQIKTGYKLMDYKIGGLEPSQLIVIAARPSVGKTGFALNMMYNIAKGGYKTSFFSLETTGTSVLKRMLSTITGIELTKIKEIKNLTPDDLTKLTNAMDQVMKLNIDIFDRSNITPQDIRAQAMRHSDEQQVIFIDYLQLMDTDAKIDRRVAVEKISRDLKIIANETGAIIVLLSQLNRGVESRQDKRPMLSDMKESGGIEADASLAMLLYRDDYYNQDNEEDTTGKSIVECNIAKNKDGETGVIEFEYFKKTQRFFT
ncbi:DnaB helicase C-terminal domain-containing protein [Staphylococcus simiae]|uniref:Bacteriophage L54a, DnaB-like helicase family protein n=1 Tax=Staphylococcus simiae CCM 7213 = CCUG 51256 TaxID=911238 RepID=G5JH57_9STAP|nr:DnaB helicase C-terminal domain-containing protein [Staphylococcus simiae]EHJ08405.1 bacteriophage L54a, DnaB-like helicase family protein [Staphylococcus simiae CCM 7213 = CCUG 51256]PNZ12635.1 damage-inducible protein [Staphylococcus simiae]SNV67028.1 prophage L54a, replicative DNA helicase [Staphylococcus simiae]